MGVCRETALEGYDSPRVTFMFHIFQRLNTVGARKGGRRKRENKSTLEKLILFIRVILGLFLSFTNTVYADAHLPACYCCRCA